MASFSSHEHKHKHKHTSKRIVSPKKFFKNSTSISMECVPWSPSIYNEEDITTSLGQIIIY